MGKKNRTQGSQENAGAEDIDGVEDEQESAAEAAADDDAAKEAATEPKVAVEEAPAEEEPYVEMSSEVEEPASEPLNLHARISQAAMDSNTSPQHIAGTLNKVEILMGGLKMALPAAIEAIDDESLHDDLTQFLNLL